MFSSLGIAEIMIIALCVITLLLVTGGVLFFVLKRGNQG